MTALDDRDPSDPRALYHGLVSNVIIGRETIEDELEKPKASQDAYLLMGLTELNVALDNAVTAIENSGLIDEEQLLCRDCGELLATHEVAEEHEHVLVAKAPPKGKPN